MIRLSIFLFAAVLSLTACTDTPSPTGTGPGVFRITAGERNKIPFRVLDSINALRNASGLQSVELSSELTAAAATHSRDMSIQNRPWHFGSDGSSPIDRVARAGYQGTMLGENISETFESDVETVAAWMQEPGTRDVILNPHARYMGIAWFQEPRGKLWWTLILGS